MTSEVKFISQFIFCLFLGFIVLKLPIVQPAIESFCIFLANSIALILGVIDDAVEVKGSIIYRYDLNNAVEISKVCSGLEFVITLTAAFLVFPVSVRKRFSALLIAFVFIQSVNAIRIISLLYVHGTFDLTVFDFVHTQLWPFLLTLIAGGYFMSWALLQHIRLNTKPLHVS